MKLEELTRVDLEKMNGKELSKILKKLSVRANNIIRKVHETGVADIVDDYINLQANLYGKTYVGKKNKEYSEEIMLFSEQATHLRKQEMINRIITMQEVIKNKNFQLGNIEKKKKELTNQIKKSFAKDGTNITNKQAENYLKEALKDESYMATDYDMYGDDEVPYVIKARKKKSQISAEEEELKRVMKEREERVLAAIAEEEEKLKQAEEEDKNARQKKKESVEKFKNIN